MYSDFIAAHALVSTASQVGQLHVSGTTFGYQTLFLLWMLLQVDSSPMPLSANVCFSPASSVTHCG